MTSTETNATCDIRKMFENIERLANKFERKADLHNDLDHLDRSNGLRDALAFIKTNVRKKLRRRRTYYYYDRANLEWLAAELSIDGKFDGLFYSRIRRADNADAYRDGVRRAARVVNAVLNTLA
jgi:hypothetical protein